MNNPDDIKKPTENCEKMVHWVGLLGKTILIEFGREIQLSPLHQMREEKFINYWIIIDRSPNTVFGVQNHQMDLL